MYAADGAGGVGGRLWWKVIRKVVVRSVSEARWSRSWFSRADGRWSVESVEMRREYVSCGDESTVDRVDESVEA